MVRVGRAYMESGGDNGRGRNHRCEYEAWG
jgi:hypothetical protein